MKIEVGYWKTRDGRKARVLCTDAPGGTPIKGYIVLDNGESVSLGWHENGLIDVPEFSLIEPWREPVKYSKDVWFEKHLSGEGKVEDSCVPYLFGCDDIRISSVKDDICDKHYRLTFEEVTE